MVSDHCDACYASLWPEECGAFMLHDKSRPITSSATLTIRQPDHGGTADDL